METQFTPLASALGGAMIGLSAVLLMASVGRIAGISGIVAGLLRRDGGLDVVRQRMIFVVGLLAAVPIYVLATGAAPTHQVAPNLVLLTIGGLLVGYGSARGSGCTSGHGVCGISRLSQRSIVATATFMATAAVAVFVLRHVIAGI